jgi:hypothetical protein
MRNEKNRLFNENLKVRREHGTFQRLVYLLHIINESGCIERNLRGLAMDGVLAMLGASFPQIISGYNSPRF